MLLVPCGRSLVVHTPAKLNLFLEVLGKRHDGYHELETLMVSVGMYDTLTFTEEDPGRIRLRDFDAASQSPEADSPTGGLPVGGENLIVRAAELLRKYAGVERGVRIELSKRIPVAAGLAGGSSDAAATLVALDQLWKTKLTPGELLELASHLGSDVGFFVSRRPAAICRGRGERVEPLDVPLGLHFVIVRPASGLLTATVFRNCQPAANVRSVGSLVDCLRRGRLEGAARLLHNALQSAAERLNPDLAHLKSLMSKEPVLGHLMSGSGSAYFGLCANRRQALWIAGRLRAERVGRVYVVQSRP
jgi:4-diphosphocytidyl-2-C-methyl-D-erythritol kinase